MNDYRYIILNKPYGYVSQFSGEGATLKEFDLPNHIYAAGRLDKDSEGLLLLTNDGPFIEQFLLHHERAYWVQVDHDIEQMSIEKLRCGVQIKTGPTAPCKVIKIEEPAVWERTPPIRVRKSIPTSWLEVILKEGKNRQIRRMTAAVGHPTLRLIRSRLGKLSLADIGLKPGEWKEVHRDQIL